MQNIGEAHQVRPDCHPDLFLFGIIVLDLPGQFSSFSQECRYILPGFFGCIDIPCNGIPPLAEPVCLDFEFTGPGILGKQVIDPCDLFGIISFPEICFYPVGAGPHEPDIKHE